jgi:hypothetical protein
MSQVAPLLRIPVGVVVERRKATSPWADVIWRPVAVLGGLPDAAPWTPLAIDREAATFYAGAAEIELYRSEADNYRRNLASAAPAIWVVLQETGGDPPYAVAAVTADPDEGEALTGPGQGIIEAVAMPGPLRPPLPRSSPSTMSSKSSRSASAITPIRKRWRGAVRGSETTMSGDESFLARWARRKRGAAPTARGQPKPENTPDGAASEAAAASVAPEETLSLFDPASLPPIEAIGAGSDIRPFLAAGVPADLTRAALRRAWSADPAIRHFIGPANRPRHQLGTQDIRQE